MGTFADELMQYMAVPLDIVAEETFPYKDYKHKVEQKNFFNTATGKFDSRPVPGGRNYMEEWKKVTREQAERDIIDNPKITKAAATVANTATYWWIDRILYMAGIAPGKADNTLYAIISYLLSDSGYGNNISAIVGVVVASHAFQRQFGGTLTEWVMYVAGLGDRPGFERPEPEPEPEPEPTRSLRKPEWTAYDRAFEQWRRLPTCLEGCRSPKRENGTEVACRKPTLDLDGYEFAKPCSYWTYVRDAPARPVDYEPEERQGLFTHLFGGNARPVPRRRRTGRRRQHK